MRELNQNDWLQLLDITRRVYGANEVDEPGAYFHMPSARYYPSLFAWDSGFHAVAMVHLDTSAARMELETLFSRVSLDGHMPHEVLIPCSATRRRPLRNFARWFAQWEYDPEGASSLVDPPVYVYSALLVYRATRDKEWLGRIWTGLCRCLDYLLDQRDLFGDGLISILHPWEAGTDSSPQFLKIMGIDPAKRTHALKAALDPLLLYRSAGKLGWDPAALAARNSFVVEDLTMNCVAARALSSAARLAAELDDERARLRYEARSALLAEAVDEMLFDGESRCYYPRWDPERPVLSKVKTAASLLPLFTEDCDAERCGALVEEHLKDPASFRGRFVVPFNPRDTLSGSRPWVERRLWAGHCIWANFNWMLAVGLGERGFLQEARELTRRTALMVLKSGFYEYYDSRNGEGRRVRDFNWPGLVLDMMARFYPELTGGPR